MNAKTHSINPSFTALMLRRPFSMVLIAGVLSVVGASTYNSYAIKQTTFAPISAYTPSVYGVESLELTSPTTGKAAIKLDDLTVNVSFVLGSAANDYGVHGSEHTEVYVHVLNVDSIVNESGDEYADFTTGNDHFNINQLILAHLRKNKLVEGV